MIDTGKHSIFCPTSPYTCIYALSLGLSTNGRHAQNEAWESWVAACSSSLVALHDAITDMALGRIDFAMVGGASAILRPAVSVAFNRLKMLSPEAACKSFSAAGNGYTRSDGVSVSPSRALASAHMATQG